jgi:hypothetical protein
MIIMIDMLAPLDAGEEFSVVRALSAVHRHL